MVNLIGTKIRLELTLDQWTEIKGGYMIRNYIWKRLHAYNKRFNSQWKIKYIDETDFEINLVEC